MISPEHNKIYFPENFLIIIIKKFFYKFNKSGIDAYSIKEEKGVYKYLLCNSFLLKGSMYIYFNFWKMEY
jgi:hypothetical protein